MANEKTKKGLGRGLRSLFGDEPEKLPKKSASNNSYLSLSIGSLARNKFQPRKLFDENKIYELSQSIKKNGLIQPIAVRPLKNGDYEIIAGERRWLAAQKAGLHEVPVVVHNLNDIQSLEVAIIENIQREDLNSIEEAKAYERLVKEFNYDHEKLSEFMGKSKSHISNTLRLLTLPDEVIKLVNEGKLSAGHVRPLVGRHNAAELAKAIISDRLNARSVENLVKRDKEKDKGKLVPRKQTDPNILLAQRRIEENLGLSTKIINNKNNAGKVIIDFIDAEQFDMLSKILSNKS